MKHPMQIVILATLTPFATSQDAAEWYPFTATGTPRSGEIGLGDWIEKPAGKHGRITRRGAQLNYNGRPIKLWGLNLCYSNCAPRKDLADKRAGFYPKYGINSVRLHKYADGPGWAGIQSEDSCVEFDPEALDRMDYQVARFKDAGIFVKLSAHFGTLKVGPADAKAIPYVGEFGKLDSRNRRVAVPHSAIFYSPEIQELHTRQTVELLRHRNPYTGLTYAEDPAICVVEVVNEQSILFYTSMQPLKSSATLRGDVGKRFSGWLEKKYGSYESVRNAWGERAFNSFRGEGFTEDEDLAEGTVLPLGNPWFWDPEQLSGSQAYRARRVLDTLEFLYELQCECYDRFVKAVRDAGYTGEVLGSNWQAGRALSHFANLHSDWRLGMVDRHNYFGGGRRRRGPQDFDASSMLARAGSGTLSSGLQQPLDRPFMLSEWIHVFPNEWGVEGPAIVGAYGMGLQGWDVSYMFQNGDSGTFSSVVGRDAWDVTAPHVLGVFPAVARQVLRGDVEEAKQTARQNVHVPSLFAGELGVDDRVRQGYDQKELDSSHVPARALAAVRCVVAFTSEYEDTPRFDIQPFEKDGSIVSATGQLRWVERESPTGGFITINTPGTKAVVGFADGETCELDGITIEPLCRFAAIYVTAHGRNESIADTGKLLVVCMARARNTGMKLNEAENRLVDKGQAPILLEPVHAALQVTERAVEAVHILDHDGALTGRTVAVTNGRFVLDGAKDRTPYYEIVLR